MIHKKAWPGTVSKNSFTGGLKLVSNCQPHPEFGCGSRHIDVWFSLLFSPYFCFISFLYFDLYVLGDDALISQGSFMQTKHLCALIHI